MRMKHITMQLGKANSNCYRNLYQSHSILARLHGIRQCVPSLELFFKVVHNVQKGQAGGRLGRGL